MSAFPLRRSLRIAARTAKSVVPSAPLKAPRPSKPTRMAEVDAEMEEYEELAYHAKQINDLSESLQAKQKQLQFLQMRPYLLDFASKEMVDDLKMLIEKFHATHETYTQQLADKMYNAVLGDKISYLVTNPDSSSYRCRSQELLIVEKNLHNLFTALYTYVMTTHHLMKSRNL